MSKLTIHTGDQGRPDMDDLLRDYFQAELPQPWPTFKAPKPARSRDTLSFWSRSGARLAIAACVGLLLIGYMSIAAYFPGAQAPTGADVQGSEIASKNGGMRPNNPNRPAVPKVQGNQGEEPMQMLPMKIDRSGRN
jgi:hypothetical protein